MKPYTVVGIYASEGLGEVVHVQAFNAEGACAVARDKASDGFEVVSAFEGHLTDLSGDASDYD